jgi:serine/threonine-protein kinase
MSSDPTAKGSRKPVRIGKYEVVSHIANGGMGAVYKARDTENNREVALKVLRPEMASRPAMVERFRREARSAAKLSHENIVTLYEFDKVGDTCYLAMEFIDGIDLHEHVNRRGPLPPDEALSIVIQACHALDHANDRSIVHRDVKPSNFLLTSQAGKTRIKLIDLGLAREAITDEFRVTRAGTTVGTIDFMSPEQARDSSRADVRSDLYSLGCTWYFLLTGQALFPKGGIGERVLKILSEKAPDVRTLNRQVSAGTAAVIHRLLAKDPDDRYQTPRDLLDDLLRLQRGEEPLALREAPDEPPAGPAKKSGHPTISRRRRPPSTDVEVKTDFEAAPPKVKRAKAKKRRSPHGRRWWYAGGAAGVLLLAVIGWLIALRLDHRPKATEEASVPPPERAVVPQPPTPEVVDPGKVEPAEPGRTAHDLTTRPATPAKWRRLYEPDKPIQPAELRQEFEAPWAKAAQDAGEPVVLTVGRGPGARYPSLSAACAAAPAGRPCLVEVHDNGPLFDGPTGFADRALTVRPGPGFRPLLVWDVARTQDARPRPAGSEDGQPLVFLDVQHGSLTLQGVDVAVKWPETASTASASLLRVRDGDLTVTGCTFSVAGGPRDGVTVARLAGTRPGPARCRFTRCLARGAALTALDLDAPGAEVLFDGCLLAGGEPPLLAVRALVDRPPTLRAVRSTLIAGHTFLRVQLARPTDRTPALNWLGWDTLISRSGPQEGGDLLSLPAEATTDKMSWRAVNCLYAGWQNLLGGSKPVPATQVAPWRRLWARIEGDEATPAAWPPAALLGGALAELPAATFRTSPDLPVGAAATAAPDQPLGCPLADLPPTRDNWLSLTSDVFTTAVPALGDDSGPPVVPTPGDGRYHGGPVDLDSTDLGLFLREMENRFGLGLRVVLHLSGTGERATSPVRLSGHSLVLYFPPTAKDAKPLALTPAGTAPAEALLAVEGGSLEVIGGVLRLPPPPGDGGLAWLIDVRGGDLRLSRCRLEGPERNPGPAYRGLVHFRGSGDPAPERLRPCLIQKTVLVSGKDGITLEGVGAGLRLRQSLLVAGGAGIHVAPGPAFQGRANVQCVLDRVTVAAREAVLHLESCPTAAPPAEPVVVQTHLCAFLNPFPARMAKTTGMILAEGSALARGLLVWHGEKDLLDEKLHFAAFAGGPPPAEKLTILAAWEHLWGKANVRHSIADLANRYRPLDAFPWALERLILPPSLSSSHGADLDALGISKKPA